MTHKKKIMSALIAIVNCDTPPHSHRSTRIFLLLVSSSMASFTVMFLLCFSLSLLIHGVASHKPILPKAAIFPLIKDPSTLQYVTHLFMGENLAPVKTVVDLGGPFLWVDCEDALLFPPHRLITRCSLQCSMAVSAGCVWGNSKTCTLPAENSVLNISASGEMSEGRLGVRFLDEMNSGSYASIDNFLFSCAPRSLLKGLAEGAQGMLGLGDSRISLPPQFSTAFGFFNRRFSICLSQSNGAIFMGGSPLETGSDISNSMMYTPLICKKDKQQEGYYINVKSIKISGRRLSLSPKLFDGGTRISTSVPYTTMGSRIYGTFVDAFTKAATSMNLTLAAPVPPFEVCFSSKEGDAPLIDLVLQSEFVKWRIDGANSMVRPSDEVMCLGFLDGGVNQRDPIVIGGYQMEDRILEFNSGNSMLGFSPPLGTVGETKCSDFGPSISSQIS